MKPTRIHTLPADYRPAVRARIHSWSRRSENGCIEWTGARDRYGYGKINLAIDGRKRQTGAHRAAWLAEVGDIPDELMTDHLCRNRACVNVAHMELVTNSVNGLRGETGKYGSRGKDSALMPQACGRHGREDGYLNTWGDGYIRWVCRICRRKASAAYKARQRPASLGLTPA